MASNKERKLKIAIIVLSVLLAVSLAALAFLYVRFGGSVPVVVPDNLITTGSMAGANAQESVVPAVRISARDTEKLGVSQDSNGNLKDWISDDENVIKIYEGQEYDQERFEVMNMFPGDSVTKEYLGQVWHKGEVDVDFTIENITSKDIPERFEEKDLKLVEVLQYVIDAEVLNANGERCELDDRDNKGNKGFVWEHVNEKPYEGDPAKTITVTTPSSNGKEPTEILYRITMFLDGPTVTNEYMNKNLFMDFKWRVPDTIEDETETQKPTSGRDDDDDGDRKPTSATTPTDQITDMTTEPSDPGHLVKPPKTGDNTVLIFGAALAAVALLVILIIAKRRKEEEDEA